jgi:hypothetical protein
MRRIAGLVLLGLAGFLITAALLAALYVPGQVKKTPLDTDSTTRLSGTASALPSGDGGPIKAVSRTVANGELSDDDVIVFDTFTCLVRDPDGTAPDCVDDQDPDNRLINASTDQFATDRRTGEAIIDEQYSSVDSALHEGLVNKFPFDVEQTTYPFWDGVLERAVDAEFQGEEVIDGLNTYLFRTVVEDEVAEISAGIEGTYSSNKIMWIDPVTGAIMKQQEQQQRRLEDGRPVLAFTMSFTDETVAANIESAKESGSSLALVERAPWVLGGLGLLALAAGALLALAGRSTASDSEYGDEAAYVDEPVHREPVPGEPSYEERYPDRTDQFFEEATAPEGETRASRRDLHE